MVKNDRLSDAKSLALLKRIIESSEVGDFILDPFCGCVIVCLAHPFMI